MAELHLVGIQAQRAPEELVAKADAEERNLCFKYLLDDAYHLIGRSRVARAIGDEYAIRVIGLHLVKGGICRHNDGLNPALRKVARSRGLHTHIEGNDGVLLLPHGLNRVGLVRRYLRGEISALHGVLGFYFL